MDKPALGKETTGSLPSSQDSSRAQGKGAQCPQENLEGREKGVRGKRQGEMAIKRCFSLKYLGFLIDL